jgi:nitroimidazol reductase NimA-like FMN-containing flavoprotein (pyridoxamine 5'-phosphate oxidase superfamily)
MIQHLGDGHPACVTVTLIDGLVLARSVFAHSVNYRSVLIFGAGELITESDQKRDALRRFMERQLPGRWGDARLPTEQELKATGVVAISLATASAKVRTGPPKDDEADLERPVWAGVLPFDHVVGEPISAPDARADQPLPEYLRVYLELHR